MDSKDYKKIAEIIRYRSNYVEEAGTLRKIIEWEFVNDLADYFDNLACEHHPAQNCSCRFDKEQFLEDCGV